MLERLALGDATVTELARPHGISMPNALQHLKVLERGGLARTWKEGRVRRCVLERAPHVEARKWIDACLDADTRSRGAVS